MRYRQFVVGLLAGLLVAGCTSEPRSRLPVPNADGTTPDPTGEGGVADLSGVSTLPPIAENPAPTITAINPKLVSAGGGATITITGTGFDKYTSVFVNNTFLFVDPALVKPTEMVVTLPAIPGAFGPATVVVRSKDGRVGKNDPVKSPMSFYATSVSFATSATYSNPTNAYGDATLSDLDGDGSLDVVIANGRTDYSHQDSFTIFMNDGSGGFGDGQYRNIGCQVVQHVRVVDVNKDNHPDLVFPCNDHGYYVGVILNYQSGGKWGNFGSPQYTGALQSYGNGCYRTTSVDVADFDKDGNVDLVVGCYHSASVQIWRGNGNGSFDFRSYLVFNSQPHYYFDVKAADFDNDGNVDVAALSAFYSVLQVAKGNGNGTLGSYQTYSMYGEPWHLLVTDVNQDKQPDIVVSHRYDQRLLVLKNSNGNFSNRTDVSTPHDQGQLQAMDMNGDGILDLIVSAREGYETQGTVLLGKGDGTFPGRNLFRGGSSSPWGLAVGLLNNDSKPDIVMSVIDNNQMQVLLSQ